MKLTLKELWPVILIYAALAIISMECAEAKSLTAEQKQVISRVSKQYNIASDKLIRIAYVESHFNQKAIRFNKNYSMDYGAFQINSIHWHTTCLAFNIFEFEGNASCAAKLLVMHKKHKDTDLIWYGRYHSKTHSKKHLYVNKLNRVPAHVLK